jgi:CRISPR system Cascade subunit CasC
MKLIELHILQSFPVSCLNRDDVGSPKSAVFGGVTRARLSSQSLKRAVREMLQGELQNAKGKRGRFVIAPLESALRKCNVEASIAREWAIRTAVALTKAKKAGEKPIEKADLDKITAKLENEAEGQVSTALFLTEYEIESMAASIAKELSETSSIRSLLAIAKKASASALAKDGVDIALFGRMVAADASLNVDGSAMFSHALSTHGSSNEIDFYSAMEEFDKNQNSTDYQAGDAGAAMIGALEFNSATYYRYTAMNLDILFDCKHLESLDQEERKAVLSAFIRATLIAVPGARQNSMNAATLPFEVLGIRKEKGQPLQLANAFESPVKSNGKGLQASSLTAMKEHLESLEKTWGPLGEKIWLTETGLDSFLDQLLAGDV